MGHGTETGLVDEFTGHAANSVGLVLDAHEGLLEVIDESNLTAGHLAELFAFHAHAAILHRHVTRILEITALILSGDETLQIRKLFLGCVQFAGDDLAELRQV